MRGRKVVIVGVIAGLSFGCSSSGTVTGPVASGAWGGVGVALFVEEAGATLEFDCALGAIPAPLHIDPAGAFSVGGTFTQEHGGPVREDEELEAVPATYAGVVAGDRMTLTIAIEGESALVGPLSLERGGAAVLRKCL